MEKLEKTDLWNICEKKSSLFTSLRRIILFTNQIYTNNIYDYMYNKLYSSIHPIQY